MLISLWFVWIFAAQLPSVSGRITPTLLPETVEGLEGSGMGGDFEGLDLSAFYDMEDDDDDDDDFDYGDDDDYADNDDDDDGNFYDDFPTNFDDVIFDTHVKSTENTPITSTKVKKITCFRCLGDGNTGCDVTNMVKDLDKYTVTCVGKCLNISAGSISVFDCARDLATKTSVCLNDFNTKMCFCDTNLCNGPVHLTDPSWIKMDFPFPLPTRHDDVKDINSNNGDRKNLTTLDDEDNTENKYFDHVENNKNNRITHKDEESLSIDNNNSSSASGILSLSETGEQVLTSLLKEISNEDDENRTSITIPVYKNNSYNKTGHTDGEEMVSPGYFPETEVDVIISSKSSSGKTATADVEGNGNSSFVETNMVNQIPPEEVQSLSVASLQDGGGGDGGGGGGASGRSSRCSQCEVLRLLICLLFVFVVSRYVL